LHACYLIWYKMGISSRIAQPDVYDSNSVE
jgi:hypothetical protein